MTAEQETEHAAMVGKPVLEWTQASDRLKNAEARLEQYRKTVSEYGTFDHKWPPSIDTPWPSRGDIDELREEIESAKAAIQGAKNNLRQLRIDPDSLS